MKLMGIINVTPDSFSDARAHFDADAALVAIARLIEEGTDVIDIGAESTRPGATPITAEEEWQRLEPVLAQLSRFSGAVFSVDTRHGETARKALGLGIGWINDVSGFADVAMVEAVKDSQCRLVVMHSLSVPADKNIVLSESADVIEEVIAFAQKRFAALKAAGIARERLIFDPGIGFGKTAAQSLALLRDIKCLNVLGVPLLVGHSRKSFLGGVLAARDDATLVVSHYLADCGVEYVRVHDVARHHSMLKMREELNHGSSHRTNFAKAASPSDGAN